MCNLRLGIFEISFWQILLKRGKLRLGCNFTEIQVFVIFVQMEEFLRFSEPEETETFKWGHNTTLLFLDVYREYRKQVGSLKIKNLKKMFEEIAKELRFKTKQNISAANCENRWKHLERTYKKFIDNNNKTGRGRKDFEYAEIMDEILGKKRNIHPVLLLSSDTVTPVTTEEANINFIATNTDTSTIEKANRAAENTENTQDKVSLKPSGSQTPKCNNKKLRVDVLKDIRQDRKQFYKKFLELEEKKLNEKKRKNDILQERNALLQQYMINELPVVSLETTE